MLLTLALPLAADMVPGAFTWTGDATPCCETSSNVTTTADGFISQSFQFGTGNSWEAAQRTFSVTTAGYLSLSETVSVSGQGVNCSYIYANDCGDITLAYQDGAGTEEWSGLYDPMLSGAISSPQRETGLDGSATKDIYLGVGDYTLYQSLQDSLGGTASWGDGSFGATVMTELAPINPAPEPRWATVMLGILGMGFMVVVRKWAWRAALRSTLTRSDESLADISQVLSRRPSAGDRTDDRQ